MEAGTVAGPTRVRETHGEIGRPLGLILPIPVKIDPYGVWIIAEIQNAWIGERSSREHGPWMRTPGCRYEKKPTGTTKCERGASPDR